MKKKNDGVKAVGRVSAVIAMVVLILAAIPVGACISLSRERNNVTAEYYGSDDVYGVLDQVSMMLSEAERGEKGRAPGGQVRGFKRPDDGGEGDVSSNQEYRHERGGRNVPRIADVELQFRLGLSDARRLQR